MKKFSYQGWDNCLRLSNGRVDLVVTLDVGPRILRFGPVDGPNLFKEYPDQMGRAGETSWKIRGGHRLWQAPEGDHCYLPDNSAVAFREISENRVVAESSAAEKAGYLQELDISLDSQTCHVRVIHRTLAVRTFDQALSPWALSVMAPGGTAILPQPPLGTHPEHLLPNRKLILWPYTELHDSRYTWDGPNLLVRQKGEGQRPTKIGVLHQCGWVGYQLDRWIFLKSVPFNPGSEYPDQGVNFELFTNDEMLELETLGALARMEKGQASEHVENWHLIEAPGFNPEKESLLSILPK